MENKIQIIEYEDKTAKTGKVYTRFKTNLGWASAFDEDVIKPLKACKGLWASVELVVDEAKGFKNLRKFNGVVEGQASNIATQANEVKPINTYRTQEIKPQEFGKSSNKNATMYVSYSKDILIALLNEKTLAADTPELMELAIELVKKAQTAFE